ncbi:MAG: START-like domain-containing protein [Bacteroidota bacterium]
MKQTKIMYTLEFPMRCSPQILFEFISTPVGLQEWFADEVNQRENQFSFTWNGAIDEAELLEEFENEYVRFRWDYYKPNEFFEFRIEQSPVTNETIFKITDFAEKNDLKDAERLWNTQVNDLKHRIGS